MQTGWWTIRRLLWGGITSLAVFAICTVVVFREKTPLESVPVSDPDFGRSG